MNNFTAVNHEDIDFSNATAMTHNRRLKFEVLEHRWVTNLLANNSCSSSLYRGVRFDAKSSLLLPEDREQK